MKPPYWFTCQAGSTENVIESVCWYENNSLPAKLSLCWSGSVTMFTHGYRNIDGFTGTSSWAFQDPVLPHLHPNRLKILRMVALCLNLLLLPHVSPNIKEHPSYPDSIGMKNTFNTFHKCPYGILPVNCAFWSWGVSTQPWLQRFGSLHPRGNQFCATCLGKSCTESKLGISSHTWYRHASRRQWHNFDLNRVLLAYPTGFAIATIWRYTIKKWHKILNYSMVLNQIKH